VRAMVHGPTTFACQRTSDPKLAVVPGLSVREECSMAVRVRSMSLSMSPCIARGAQPRTFDQLP
jgi:hypothetical protein